MTDKNYSTCFQTEKFLSHIVGLPILQSIYKTPDVDEVEDKEKQIMGVDFIVKGKTCIDAKYLWYNNGGIFQLETWNSSGYTWTDKGQLTDYYLYIDLTRSMSYLYSRENISKFISTHQNRREFFNKGHTTKFINFRFDEVKARTIYPIDCGVLLLSHNCKFTPKKSPLTEKDLLATTTTK